MSGARRGLWLAAYALAMPLAFPHLLGGGVIDLGWLLAWWVPAALWLGLRGRSVRQAAVLAFASAWLAHALLFHWIYVVTVRYGNAPPLVGVLAPSALALYPAALVAAFGAALAALERRGRGGAWSVALLYTAQDHLRAFVLTGFPWGTLGYAQHQNLALLPLASVTGVYGLSFVSALGGVAVAQWVASHGAPAASRRGALAALGLVAGVHLGGAASWLASRDREPQDTLRVATLQGNIDQGVKWSPTFALRTLEIYEQLSRQAAAEGAEVILWPETAVPGSIATDPGLRERIALLARDLEAVLVVGGVGIEPDSGAARYYDSAFVFDAEGRLRDRYDKSHLVPFGEYLPLRDLLGSFLTAVATGIAPGDVTPGLRPRPVALPGSNGFVPVGVPICYELIFPDLVRRFVRDGAVVLFALTNDAWYGRTGAPYQFLAMTAMRSAENRVWTARAANTGVSAIIDHHGRVREQTPVFERGLLVADVPLRPAPHGGSPYTRYGNVFVLGCWGALAILARPRRRPSTGGEG